MARASHTDDYSAQGDFFDNKDALEMSVSPLMGDLSVYGNSSEDMLGRAPRPLRKPSPNNMTSPSPHTVRLMEVVPVNQRMPTMPEENLSESVRSVVAAQRSSSLDMVSRSRLSVGRYDMEFRSSQGERLSIAVESSPVDRPMRHTRASSRSSGEMSWVMPLRKFSSKKTRNMGLETSRLPKGIRTYYERQDDLISAYEAMATESKLNVLCENNEDNGLLASRLSQLSFFVNLALMIAKALAVNMSNSLSIISSLVDSVVDLISGIIIWWTSHAIRTTNLYVYPVGRSRLEPVAIIILSVIMSLASFEVMISSVRKMVAFGNEMEGIAVFELPTLLIASSTVVIKFGLAVFCYLLMKKSGSQSSAVDALIQDHRNDTMSNLVAILCGYLGSVQFANQVNTKQVAYIDPAGAIVIALYIIISWWQTGKAQLKMVTGYTADPGFLSQITWIALHHSPKILKIDTVRAFHFGSKFLVEVDIVLCGDTPLSESHDIGEKLQQKLENLPRVERAFVHVDYEWDHRPQDEHQVT